MDGKRSEVGNNFLIDNRDSYASTTLLDVLLQTAVISLRLRISRDFHAVYKPRSQSVLDFFLTH